MFYTETDDRVCVSHPFVDPGDPTTHHKPTLVSISTLAL